MRVYQLRICCWYCNGSGKEGENFVVLSDILGDEDHLGDMDFKVAGSRNGVSALQMDIKIEGITREIMQVALNQAKSARLHILGVMEMQLASLVQKFLSLHHVFTLSKSMLDRSRCYR
ncbi:hypothetical protein ACVXG7_24255 [Enterobacter hormaechei]